MARTKVDKSVLTISEPKRIRCKEHLRFVASQPCVVCGRFPSHAHHIRHAQSRGLGLKVSDEFTVPLCATHHHHVHTMGKEQEWWQERNLDPLKVASALWRQSRQQNATREASVPVPSCDGTEVRPEAAGDQESKAWRGLPVHSITPVARHRRSFYAEARAMPKHATGTASLLIAKGIDGRAFV